MIADGTASAGMVAKLRACRDALTAGVASIAIVSGRDIKGFADAAGTRIGQTSSTGR
jgi:acetylglutamate kinase